MTVWVIAGLLGLATGVRIGWALVNKQSLVSTAMIVALGSLGLVAALNWEPLALLLDTALRWPNLSVGLSQVALVFSAAGSCVMITSAASARGPEVIRRIALVQYAVAALIAAVTAVTFFAGGRQVEMAPQEYLKRILNSPGTSLSWLVPSLYVLLALSLVVWAGLRHSDSSRRGRALFVFTIGIVLILLASAFLAIRSLGSASLLGVGTAATMLGCAMVVVAAGALLPTVEDWFTGRREIKLVEPLLSELLSRQPETGIGVRPRGPVVFQVAEKLSLISDALFLEASAAHRDRTGGRGRSGHSDEFGETLADLKRPDVTPAEQARAVAEWIYAGCNGAADAAVDEFPGPEWLRQPDSHSDREWIIEIARQYNILARVA